MSPLPARLPRHNVLGDQSRLRRLQRVFVYDFVVAANRRLLAHVSASSQCRLGLKGDRLWRGSPLGLPHSYPSRFNMCTVTKEQFTDLGGQMHSQSCWPHAPDDNVFCYFRDFEAQSKGRGQYDIHQTIMPPRYCGHTSCTHATLVLCRFWKQMPADIAQSTPHLTKHSLRILLQTRHTGENNHQRHS